MLHSKGPYNARIVAGAVLLSLYGNEPGRNARTVAGAVRLSDGAKVDLAPSPPSPLENRAGGPESDRPTRRRRGWREGAAHGWRLAEYLHAAEWLCAADLRGLSMRERIQVWRSLLLGLGIPLRLRAHQGTQVPGAFISGRRAACFRVPQRKLAGVGECVRPLRMCVRVREIEGTPKQPAQLRAAKLSECPASPEPPRRERPDFTCNCTILAVHERPP